MRDVRAWWLLLAGVALATVLAVYPVVPAGSADGPTPRPVLTLPMQGGSLVRLASIPEPNWRPGHRGVDIAALQGANVVSPGSGRVIFAGEVAGRSVVTVRLDVGVDATLEPVIAAVAVGDRVSRGTVVGTVSDQPTHCTPAVCVHWGIKDGPRYIDPLDWLVGYGPVVLLPHR